MPENLHGPSRKYVRSVLMSGLHRTIDNNTANNCMSAPQNLDLTDIICLSGHAFIEALYIKALEREPDIEGLDYFYHILGLNGNNKVIAYIICSSKEFGQRATVLHLDEYKKEYECFIRNQKIKNIPILGWVWQFINLPGRVSRIEVKSYEQNFHLSGIYNNNIHIRQKINNIEKATIENHQAVSQSLENKINALKDKISEAEERITQLISINCEKCDVLESSIAYNTNKINNIVVEQNREITLSQIEQRWRIIDKFHLLRFENFDYQCPICNARFNTCNAKKYTTECRFKGGFIERYECPNCGVIVGPLKMLLLDDQEFDLDYTQHYTVFAEGDSTEGEKLAFYKLNPDVNKVYLNYGCGGWTRAMEELRREGFNVYGYEPYASKTNNPYIITSKIDLVKMKFDGVFTNNLLEHLKNPINDFAFFKSLLKDNNCKMSHSTGCFEYLYEYTRFHLFFYTGRSVQLICEKAGLKVCDYYKLEHFNNTNDTVIGYVFTSI
jgi:hypothetical protein